MNGTASAAQAIVPAEQGASASGSEARHARFRSVNVMASAGRHICPDSEDAISLLESGSIRTADRKNKCAFPVDRHVSSLSPSNCRGSGEMRRADGRGELATALLELVALVGLAIGADGDAVVDGSADQLLECGAGLEMVSTHCRMGCLGNTWSTRCAALSTMRRAPQDGQKPRHLQENATSCSC